MFTDNATTAIGMIASGDIHNNDDAELVLELARSVAGACDCGWEGQGTYDHIDVGLLTAGLFELAESAHRENCGCTGFDPDGARAAGDGTPFTEDNRRNDLYFNLPFDAAMLQRLIQDCHRTDYDGYEDFLESICTVIEANGAACRFEYDLEDCYFSEAVVATPVGYYLVDPEWEILQSCDTGGHDDERCFETFPGRCPAGHRRGIVFHVGPVSDDVRDWLTAGGTHVPEDADLDDLEARWTGNMIAEIAAKYAAEFPEHEFVPAEYDDVPDWMWVAVVNRLDGDLGHMAWDEGCDALLAAAIGNDD